MSTQSSVQPANERAALLIGGLAHEEWAGYEIDSDLLTPADAWRMRLTLSPDADGDFRLPAAVRKGVEAQVRIGGDLVMSGRVDDIRVRVAKREQSLEILGRDGAATLPGLA